MNAEIAVAKYLLCDKETAEKGNRRVRCRGKAKMGGKSFRCDWEIQARKRGLCEVNAKRDDNKQPPLFFICGFPHSSWARAGRSWTPCRKQTLSYNHLHSQKQIPLIQGYKIWHGISKNIFIGRYKTIHSCLFVSRRSDIHDEGTGTRQGACRCNQVGYGNDGTHRRAHGKARQKRKAKTHEGIFTWKMILWYIEYKVV